MSSKGHSQKDFIGRGYTHYDEKGKKVGTSKQGIFGDYTNYDAKGKKIGTTRRNVTGGYSHYDSKGRKIGTTYEGVTGYYHKDTHGNSIGSSRKGVGGQINHSDSDACYIATCIYESYDCREVWTLRRFRDYKLKCSAAGRRFIRAYYALSPKLVSKWGDNRIFRAGSRLILNQLVRRLRKRGYASTPYQDRRPS